MEGVAWTAIRLLAATLLGSLFYLGGRIDALAARLDARIDAQSADLGGRIDALGARLDARIERLATALEDHVRRHAG